MKDELIVYGANCTWWDDISKTAMVPGTLMDAKRPRSGLPCCPHCGSVLFQVPQSKWDDGMKKYETDAQPGYVAMMTWARGKCFRKMSDLRHAYTAETGVVVP